MIVKVTAIPATVLFYAERMRHSYLMSLFMIVITRALFF